MKPLFDTITDWIAIPLFVVAIVMLVRADLISLRTSGDTDSTAYQLARQAGGVVAAVALLITMLRFAVLASG